MNKLINALEKIQQMSDCGSYEAAIIEMKSIATDALKEYKSQWEIINEFDRIINELQEQSLVYKKMYIADAIKLIEFLKKEYSQNNSLNRELGESINEVNFERARLKENFQKAIEWCDDRIDEAKVILQNNYTDSKAVIQLDDFERMKQYLLKSEVYSSPNINTIEWIDERINGFTTSNLKCCDSAVLALLKEIKQYLLSLNINK